MVGLFVSPTTVRPRRPGGKRTSQLFSAPRARCTGRRLRHDPAELTRAAPKHCDDRRNDPDREPQWVTGGEIEGKRETQDEPQNRVAEFGHAHLPLRGA